MKHNRRETVCSAEAALTYKNLVCMRLIILHISIDREIVV
jgi:hypothetical protein